MVGLFQETWDYHQNGYGLVNLDRELKLTVDQIIADRPDYGYRRTRREQLQ